MTPTSSQIPLMNPYPCPQSILILDNCAIHRGERLRVLAQRAGIRLQFLPPYSPDYNPVGIYISIYIYSHHVFISFSLQIEQTFFYIKSWLRRHRDWVLSHEDPVDALDIACMTI